MKGRKNRHFSGRNKNNQIKVGDRGREVIKGLNENSIIIKQFKEFASELDEKHDRYERLVKHSRDITIESKRIIFLLHTLDQESKRDTILKEADTRLNTLMKGLFKQIAQELDNEDQYLYMRAFRAGLQEFVEALTFYYYLYDKTLHHWDNVAKSMTYTEDQNKPDDTNQESVQKTIKTIVDPGEFVLGIADLTGELMRKCINNLATGDIDSCFETCNFVRSLYNGFLSCDRIAGRLVEKKLYVLKQSLLKMENVCYTIRVRGSEIPKHMLADVAAIRTEDMQMEDDEGYQVY